ncbi:HAD domain-containing protein [Roseomonas xinghualingensis]|uniref:HAD domain-containing protein n=1 Tax=Roseomonas xinghualingensis TaxID=2986475 RepID=UPI0021F0C511|nr:HAD domain-containing protein [Roseomonas sp. SXEYE001]MCV4208330.1 HAD domain-containing protein [Roseomonas sp. SXEYE001]
MTDRVLFLDIDGVLLSGRAWMLPQNRELQARATGLPRCEASEAIGREAVFDASSVALVTRICEVTGVQLVVCSSWRYTVGLDQTRAKLLEQGLPEEILHPDWACELFCHGSPDKGVDVHRWLSKHAATQYGNWLVLDDTDLVPGATLRTDALDGVSVRDAAAAVRFFSSTDAALGVMPLSKEDVDQVVGAFGGNWIKACRWLEGVDELVPRLRRPSALLARGEREEVRRRLGDTVSLWIDRWW